MQINTLRGQFSLLSFFCCGISLGLVKAQKRAIYLVLLHHPIVNRQGELITTSVTNMDIHDISRSSKTFGLDGMFIVTPLEEQHQMVSRILDHWRSEQARSWHPDRVEAVSLVRLADDFAEVKAEIRNEAGETPLVVLTDARPLQNALSYEAFKRELGELSEKQSPKPIAIVFGTGWGVAESFYPEVDRILAPVYGPEGVEGYNHLSVRAAVAIILDRLFGL